MNEQQESNLHPDHPAVILESYMLQDCTSKQLKQIKEAINYQLHKNKEESLEVELGTYYDVYINHKSYITGRVITVNYKDSYVTLKVSSLHVDTAITLVGEDSSMIFTISLNEFINQAELS